MKETVQFLDWKIEQYPQQFSYADLEIVKNRKYENFTDLSYGACSYSKNLMRKYSEILWQKRMDRQFQLNGFSDSPKISTKKLKFPHGTSRKHETLLLSLFYPNNLLNSFLYRFDKSRFPSPNCNCGQGLQVQDSLHLLQDCNHVNQQLRLKMKEILSSSPNQLPLLSDCSFLISWSRNTSFFDICNRICMDCQPHLRSEIVL